MTKSAWSPERDETLRTLWADPNQSGATIGLRFGVSRSAVIARANRLGLSGMDWNDVAVAELRKHAAEGLSAGESAKVLGVTRNTALSKAHRLGIKFRTGTTNKARVQASRKASGAARGQVQRISQQHAAPHLVKRAHANCEPSSIPFKDRTCQPDERGTVTLLELRAHHCRWPLGTPGADDFAFCGAPMGPRAPYCDRHAARAYQPAPAKPLRAPPEYSVRSTRSAA